MSSGAECFAACGEYRSHRIVQTIEGGGFECEVPQGPRGDPSQLPRTVGASRVDEVLAHDGLTTQEAQDSVGGVVEDSGRVTVVEMSDAIGELRTNSFAATLVEDVAKFCESVGDRPCHWDLLLFVVDDHV